MADALSRVLHAGGAEVIVCRNVTDVDDVLLAAASGAGSPYNRITAIQQFFFDHRHHRARGGVSVQVEPRAHAHVRQVIDLAEGLLDEARRMSRRAGLFSGGAVAHRAALNRAAALRLSAEYGIAPMIRARTTRSTRRSGMPPAPAAAWDSPSGPGRPGWHAECAAMALHVFGPAVDVQAGGGDLRFPHHAYQAAMAEAFTGVTPFARARLNAGVVRVAGAKMAKPAGNLVLVGDLLAGYPAAAIRLLILDRRWDEDWDYERAGLDAAAARLDRLHAAAARPRRGVAGLDDAADAAVRAALASDLDVSAALRIAEEEGGSAARAVGSLLALW